MEISNRDQYRVYKPSYVLKIDSLQKDSEYFECDYTVLQSIQQKLQNSIQSDWECCCQRFYSLMSDL